MSIVTEVEPQQNMYNIKDLNAFALLVGGLQDKSTGPVKTGGKSKRQIKNYKRAEDKYLHQRLLLQGRTDLIASYLDTWEGSGAQQLDGETREGYAQKLDRLKMRMQVWNDRLMILKSGNTSDSDMISFFKRAEKRLKSLDKDAVKIAKEIQDRLNTVQQSLPIKVDSIEAYQPQDISPKVFHLYNDAKLDLAKEMALIDGGIKGWEDGGAQKVNGREVSGFQARLDELRQKLLVEELIALEKPKKATKGIKKLVKEAKQVYKELNACLALLGDKARPKVTFLDVDFSGALERVTDLQYFSMEKIDCSIRIVVPVPVDKYPKLRGLLQSTAQAEAAKIYKKHFDFYKSVVIRFDKLMESAKEIFDENNMSRWSEFQAAKQAQYGQKLAEAFENMKTSLEAEIPEVVLGVMHDDEKKEVKGLIQKKGMRRRMILNGVGASFSAGTIIAGIVGTAVGSVVFPPLGILSFGLACWSLATNAMQVYEFHRQKSRSVEGLIGGVKSRVVSMEAKYKEALQEALKHQAKAKLNEISTVNVGGTSSDSEDDPAKLLEAIKKDKNATKKEMGVIVLKALFGTKFRVGLGALSDDLVALQTRLLEHEQSLKEFSQLIITKLDYIEKLKEQMKVARDKFDPKEEQIFPGLPPKARQQRYEAMLQLISSEILKAEIEVNKLFMMFERVRDNHKNVTDEVALMKKEVDGFREMFTDKNFVEKFDIIIKVIKVLLASSVSITDSAIHMTNDTAGAIDVSMAVVGTFRRIVLEVGKEKAKRDAKKDPEEVIAKKG